MFREDYIKEQKNIESTDEQRQSDLFKEIENSKNRLNNLYENINFIDKDLTDYYVYQIKAEEAKFGFLIRQIKNESKQKEIK